MRQVYLVRYTHLNLRNHHIILQNCFMRAGVHYACILEDTQMKDIETKNYELYPSYITADSSSFA